MKLRKSQIVVAIADVERVMLALPDQIDEANRCLFRILEEEEQAGSLSAVRPYSEIEADEELVRSYLRSLRAKERSCARKLSALREAKREWELAEAKAKAEALAEQSARKARKARVSG